MEIFFAILFGVVFVGLVTYAAIHSYKERHLGDEIEKNRKKVIKEHNLSDNQAEILIDSQKQKKYYAKVKRLSEQEDFLATYNKQINSRSSKRPDVVLSDTKDDKPMKYNKEKGN